MRIGIDARVFAFSPVHRAGAYYWNLNLIRALSENDRNNEYLLLCRPFESHLIPDLGPCFKPVEIKAFREYNDFGQYEEQVGLEKELNALGLDLYMGLYFVIPLFRNFPAIALYDDMIPWILMKKETHLIPGDHPIGKDMCRFQSWKERSAKSAEGLVTISESTANDISKYWNIPRNKIEPVLLSIEPDFKAGASKEELEVFRRKYDLPNEYILYVATIEPRKNVVGLIRALKILRTKFQNPVPLVMVGPRGLKYKELFEKTVMEEFGGFEGIRMFSDYIPRKELPLFYNAATIFCFPSFYEGFGLTLLEALSCGLPAVTSPISSLPEVAGKAALYADPFKPEDIAKAMNELLASKALREKLSREALVQAQRFSYARSARKLLEYMTQVGQKYREKYALSSIKPDLQQKTMNMMQPVYSSVLVFRTAPREQVQDSLKFLRRFFKADRLALLTQVEDSSWDNFPGVVIHKILPSGLLNWKKFFLLPWLKLGRISKNVVVVLYNNPVGHGYAIWNLVVLILGLFTPVYSYSKEGKLAPLSLLNYVDFLLRPLRRIYLKIQFHLRLFKKKRTK